jgi:teichoic acid ribitol-phosphate primase
VKAPVLSVRIATVRLGFLLGRAARGRIGPRAGEVVLATAHSGALTGNLAAIRGELDRRGIRSVGLARRPGRSVAGRIGDLWFHLLAGFHLARARLFVVDDYFFPLYVVEPRPATTVVQTWHACGALKKFGYSVLDKSFGADAELVRRVRIHGHYDVCLVSSSAVTPWYADAFRQPPSIFVSELGVPRTDVLADATRRTATAEAVRARYRLPVGKRVVLYAPTFRGDSITDPGSGADLDLPVLAERLASDHVVLLRLHPFVRARISIPPALSAFVVDASDHPDINELMLASDVLVTDYSTAMFEFALLDRPIALFAPDLAAYERERGFYFDYRSAMPGPVFDSTPALADFLRAGTFDLEPVRAFAGRWFDVADAHASERFVDRIVLPALAGRTVSAAELRSP